MFVLDNGFDAVGAVCLVKMLVQSKTIIRLDLIGIFEMLFDSENNVSEETKQMLKKVVERNKEKRIELC